MYIQVIQLKEQITVIKQQIEIKQISEYLVTSIVQRNYTKHKVFTGTKHKNTNCHSINFAEDTLQRRTVI